ncbi:hypothetical protein Pelo_7458 [Pelomyxa schiedti]|nr:hypothetical protein Pelo_7458 [Pelomyxa schiedti]
MGQPTGMPDGVAVLVLPYVESRVLLVACSRVCRAWHTIADGIVGLNHLVTKMPPSSTILVLVPNEIAPPSTSSTRTTTATRRSTAIAQPAPPATEASATATKRFLTPGTVIHAWWWFVRDGHVAVNFHYGGVGCASQRIAYHMNVRTNVLGVNLVVQNHTNADGRWGKEVTTPAVPRSLWPFAHEPAEGLPHRAKIVCTQLGWQLFLNGKRQSNDVQAITWDEGAGGPGARDQPPSVNFAHRIPLEEITHITTTPEVNLSILWPNTGH